MRKKSKTGRLEDVEPERIELSDELAWRVHENAKGWIVQVDVKSAAALAIEAAVLGFAFVLVANPSLLAQLTSLSRWVLAIGLGLLLLSVALSALVLLPRIKLREPLPAKRSYLYFGHLRHWDKVKLGVALASNQVDAGEIADQVIKMSQIAWRKHVLLKWSLSLLLAGMVLIGVLCLILLVDTFPDVFGSFSLENQQGEVPEWR